MNSDGRLNRARVAQDWEGWFAAVNYGVSRFLVSVCGEV